VILDPQRDGDGGLVPSRGLLALPEPADGDLFFDIEGARYYCEDGREFGLQYLFGVVDTAEADETGLPRYTQIWAFDRAGEKRAFQELIDFITERRARHPGLHVYHYNHYEPTSVDHLTELHGTRQEAVGALMGRFATREYAPGAGAGAAGRPARLAPARGQAGLVAVLLPPHADPGRTNRRAGRARRAGRRRRGRPGQQVGGATVPPLRRPPDDGSDPAGSLRNEGETASAAAVRLAVSLRRSYLPLQGPPGTGKTYTAAEQILELIAHGRTVVIYSMATSSADQAPRGLDFLYDPHRLNVATSRARALAIIVASPDLIRVSCRTPHQMILANALCQAWETGR